MSLHLEIVTPHGKAYESPVDQVILPTKQGEVGLLPGHLPLLTQVDAGELRVLKKGKTEYLAVSSGFAQVMQDKISVLTESAIDVEEIDPTVVEQAMAKAQAELKEAADVDPEEMERLETMVRYHQAQLLVKRKKR
ncbi:MAG: ATP synthase F1 subunit epsilon [Opitutales bacterium]|nr:ATP synthase F1 subunit epsilon [Opitutales bacterium]